MELFYLFCEHENSVYSVFGVSLWSKNKHVIMRKSLSWEHILHSERNLCGQEGKKQNKQLSPDPQKKKKFL